MILYTVFRSIGPLCVSINMGKGVRVLSGNFKGVYPFNGFDYNPGNDVKGNGSSCNTCNPVLIH